MPKFASTARQRWMALLPLALAVALPACQKNPEETSTPAQTTMEVSPTLSPPTFAGPGLKVKVVEVELQADGTIKPIGKVKIKKKQDIAIWVTNGVSMNITWKPTSPPPGNPFTDFKCTGPFCGTLIPSDAPPATYLYTVEVDGATLDPEVEVEG